MWCSSTSLSSDILNNQSALFDVYDSAVYHFVRVHIVDANQTESRVIMKNGSQSRRQKPQQAPFSIPGALQLNNIYITLQYTPTVSNLAPLFALEQTVNQASFFSLSHCKSWKFKLVACVNMVLLFKPHNRQKLKKLSIYMKGYTE